MRNQKIKWLITVLLLILITKVYAQPGFPSPPPTSAPLDGGILIALLAGLGIGIKKIYGKGRNKN